MSLRIERWPRSRFLNYVQATYRQMLAAWEARGRPAGFTLIKPSDEVACDLCGGNVWGDEVPLVMVGTEQITHALCEACVLDVDSKR